MAHYLYKFSAGTPGKTRYKKITELKPGLAGRNGLIYKSLKNQIINEKIPFTWVRHETELLEHLFRSNAAAENCLVFDIMPSAKKTVFLARLKTIWGFTYETWTVLLLSLEQLIERYDVADARTRKTDFHVINKSIIPIFEFLYLNGGFREDSLWTWGRIGYVNGALLYPDALEYFSRVINEFNSAPR